jgi:hypothetical protein
MKRATAGLSTKSDKIRVLGRAGYTRQQIADFLGIRYQHVRNVLVDAERKKKAGGLAEPQARWRSEASDPVLPGSFHVQADGTVTLSADVLAKAGFAAGDAILVHVAGDGQVELLSEKAGLKRAQEIVRRYVPGDVSLVDVLLAERRREFEAEERGAVERSKK